MDNYQTVSVKFIPQRCTNRTAKFVSYNSNKRRGRDKLQTRRRRCYCRFIALIRKGHYTNVYIFLYIHHFSAQLATTVHIFFILRDRRLVPSVPSTLHDHNAAIRPFHLEGGLEGRWLHDEEVMPFRIDQTTSVSAYCAAADRPL